MTVYHNLDGCDSLCIFFQICWFSPQTFLSSLFSVLVGICMFYCSIHVDCWKWQAQNWKGIDPCRKIRAVQRSGRLLGLYGGHIIKMAAAFLQRIMSSWGKIFYVRECVFCLGLAIVVCVFCRWMCWNEAEGCDCCCLVHSWSEKQTIHGVFRTRAGSNLPECYFFFFLLLLINTMNKGYETVITVERTWMSQITRCWNVWDVSGK